MSRFKLITLMGIVISSLTSCTQNEPNENGVATTAIDSVKVIEAGVDFILKTERLSNDYYLNPLKIVKSRNVPSNTVFFTNGFKTQIVNEKLNLKIRIDSTKVQTYVEVIELKNAEKDRVLVTLLFRTTGNEFAIWLKKGQSKCLEIDSVSHSKI